MNRQNETVKRLNEIVQVVESTIKTATVMEQVHALATWKQARKMFREANALGNIPNSEIFEAYYRHITQFIEKEIIEQSNEQFEEMTKNV